MAALQVTNPDLAAFYENIMDQALLKTEAPGYVPVSKTNDLKLELVRISFDLGVKIAQGMVIK